MGGNILRVGYRMGFNTIEFVTGRVTGRVSKKAKKGDIRLSDNWFSDNCPALLQLSIMYTCKAAEKKTYKSYILVVLLHRSI